MSYALPQDPVDSVVLVAVGLGALVLARLAIVALLAVASRGTSALARSARAIAAALRPGIARRAGAALLGLGAPVGALLPTAAAAPAPVTHVGPATTTFRGAPPLPVAHDRSAVSAARSPEVHVVRRGESLWSIARDHLGSAATDARVARAWPRWWAANRRVIGSDPSLIVPGQHLRVPGRRSAGTPTQPHAAPAPNPGSPLPSAQSLDPDRR